MGRCLLIITIRVVILIVAGETDEWMRWTSGCRVVHRRNVGKARRRLRRREWRRHLRERRDGKNGQDSNRADAGQGAGRNISRRAGRRVGRSTIGPHKGDNRHHYRRRRVSEYGEQGRRKDSYCARKGTRPRSQRDIDFDPNLDGVRPRELVRTIRHRDERERRRGGRRDRFRLRDAFLDLWLQNHFRNHSAALDWRRLALFRRCLNFHRPFHHHYLGFGQHFRLPNNAKAVGECDHAGRNGHFAARPLCLQDCRHPRTLRRQLHWQCDRQ